MGHFLEQFHFAPDFKFLGHLGDQKSLPDLSELGPPKLISPEELQKHLMEDELNAATLLGSECCDLGEVRYERAIYVARTANPDFFYGAYYPPEDPDDVITEGEDLPNTLCFATDDDYRPIMS